MVNSVMQEMLVNFRLLVSRGPDAGRVFTIGEGQTRLGRGSAATVQLSDRRVSRDHCVFDLANGVLEVSDADSTGGTHVNGRPVKHSLLRPGDSVSVGDSILCLFFDDGN